MSEKYFDPSELTSNSPTLRLDEYPNVWVKLTMEEGENMPEGGINPQRSAESSTRSEIPVDEVQVQRILRELSENNDYDPGESTTEELKEVRLNLSLEEIFKDSEGMKHLFENSALIRGVLQTNFGFDDEMAQKYVDQFGEISQLGDDEIQEATLGALRSLESDFQNVISASIVENSSNVEDVLGKIISERAIPVVKSVILDSSLTRAILLRAGVPADKIDEAYSLLVAHFDDDSGLQNDPVQLRRSLRGTLSEINQIVQNSTSEEQKATDNNEEDGEGSDQLEDASNGGGAPPSKPPVGMSSFGEGDEDKQEAIKNFLRKQNPEISEDELEEAARYVMGQSPEALIEEASKIQKLRDPRQDIDDLISRITQEKNKDERKKLLQQLENRYVRPLKLLGDDMKTFEAMSQQIHNLYDGDAVGLEALIQSFADDLKKNYSETSVLKERGDKISSLEDFIEMIINTEESKWGRGGDLSLIEVGEGGVEQVNLSNFYAWLRSKILYYDDANSDGEVRFFQEISIPTTFRDYNIGSIINTPSFWRKRREVIKKVVAGSGDPRELMDKNMLRAYQMGEDVEFDRETRQWVWKSYSYDRDDRYQVLKEAMLYEVWLSNDNHNGDVAYRSAMGQSSEVVKAQFKSFYNNLLTADRNRMLRILKLPGVAGDVAMKEFLDEEQIAIRNKEGISYQNQAGELGNLIRRNILAYNYIRDEEMMNKIMGVDGMGAFYEGIVKAFFRREIHARGVFVQKTVVDSKTGNPYQVEGLNYEKLQDLKEDLVHRYEGMMMSELDGLFEGVYFGIENGSTDEEIKRIKDDNIERTRALAIKLVKYHYLDDKAQKWSDLSVVTKEEEAASRLVLKRGFKKNGEAREHVVFLKSRADEFNNAFNIFSQVKHQKDYINLVRKGIRMGITQSLKTKRARALVERDLEFMRSISHLDQGEKNKFIERKVYDILTKEDSRDEVMMSSKREIDTDYAEMWAWRFAYYTGISAANDTQAIGFDKDTERQNLGENRARQKSGRGPAGDMGSIFGVKSLGRSLWEGLRVKTSDTTAFDKTLLEAIQGGQGDNINFDTFNDFDFEGNATRQYASENIANAAKVASLLLDTYGMNLTQYFKKDQHGYLKFDAEKFDKDFLDGPWHDLRYALDQPSFLYNNMVRGWYRVDTGMIDPKNGREIRPLMFKSLPLRELMFDDEVINMGMLHRKELSPRPTQMAREVLAYLIAKEFNLHKSGDTEHQKWTIEQYEMIEAALRALPLQVTQVFDKNGKPIGVRPTLAMFSHHEMEHILKVAGVNINQMIRKELLIAQGEGALDGLFETLKYLNGQLSKMFV